MADTPFHYKADDDDSLLLNESNKGNKNGKYESNSVLKHWKILVSGFGVIVLISLGVVIGAVFNGKSSSEVHRPVRSNNLRLPDNIKPIKYNLFLHPNITDNKFGFTGHVKILVEASKVSDSIVLHSKHLNITSITVYKGEDAMKKESEKATEQLKVDDHKLHKKHEFLTIMLAKNSKLGPKQKAVVSIKFSGSLSEGLEGFYKSSYKTKSGEKRYLATTHFEATHARSAFPCFDEPAMKANFSISMVREGQHTALSNMPRANTKERKSDGLHVDYFKESVKMSTYLVAFIVCDYGATTRTTKNNVTVKVWAPKEQIDQTVFAADTAVKVLDYYDEFFQVKFPLPKQDLIAIPDFAAGAMENWGLITYRLTSILYDEKESSSANKQWVAVVIAHELAHQWFGNLVTMKWWNDLWLNEGFAAFVEFIGANVTNAGWQMMDQFIVDDTQSSLTLDSHANSHPISVPVHDPAAINEIFDTISYDKGASIIRMMKKFIGSKAFHTGLTNYLKKYQYSNAVSDDLWGCLTKAQNENDPKHKIDVKSVMDTWTLQMGYPVITVKKNKKEKYAILTQKHFLIDVDTKIQKSVYDYKWDVPLTYYFQHQPENKNKWFYRKHDSVKIDWNEQSGWMKANIDQIGFYRVNYDDENWQALSKQLEDDHKQLSTSDRSNLIDDAFELAKANLLSQIKALDMTKYLTSEKEYVPWITALSSLSYIGELLLTLPGYEYYESYIVKQVAPMVKELGWKDEGTHLQKYLRGAVLRSSVHHNDSQSVNAALKIFNDWMYQNKSIPANMRSTIYLAGIKYGGEKQWNHMYKIYETTQFPAEQRKIMFALTDTTNKTILKKYLSWTMDNSKIRSQDTCSVIEHISLNPVATEMTYNFVKKHWHTLFKRYGKGSFDMSRLIKSVFGRFKTEEGLKEAQDFLSTQKHQLGSGKLAAKQAIAAIKNHIAWLKKNEKDVVAWLKKKVE